MLCWILDRICFTKTINYHVLWHILSGFASFSGSMVYYENRKLLDKKAVASVPGRSFGLENNIRFSYAISSERINLAVQRMKELLK